jgi:hypothetical protein
VTTVVPREHWGVQVFTQLTARDTWRAGGSNKVVALIEDQELRAAEKKRAQFNDEGAARHVDAYRSFKYRTGQRVSMAHRGPAQHTQVKPLHFDRKPLVQLASA